MGLAGVVRKRGPHVRVGPVAYRETKKTKNDMNTTTEPNDAEILAGYRQFPVRIAVEKEGQKSFEPLTARIKILSLDELPLMNDLLARKNAVADEVALYTGLTKEQVAALHPNDAIKVFREGRALNFTRWADFSEEEEVRKRLRQSRQMEMLRAQLGPERMDEFFSKVQDDAQEAGKKALSDLKPD